MRYNFCIVLEKINSPYVQNIEFYGSSTQANRVLKSLSYALENSDYESLTLFCGQNQTNKINLKK